MLSFKSDKVLIYKHIFTNCNDILMSLLLIQSTIFFCKDSILVNGLKQLAYN